MGSWANLTISDSVLDGMVPVDGLDRNFGEFDTDMNNAVRLEEVKNYIEMRVIGQNALFSSRGDGPEEILDAAIDINKAFVDDLIQQMMGYLWVSNFYDTGAIGNNGIYIDKAEKFKHKFEECFSALTKYLVRDPDFIEQLETTVDDDLDSFSQPTWVA